MLQMIPKWRAFIDHWLQKQAQVCVTQPLSKTVSANDKAYFAHIGVRKLAWRQLRHALYFKLSGHGKRCFRKIPAHWKRGLWLYKGIPQIGDALMDLAPRSLLRDQGLSIDLLTDEHIAATFDGDPWFENVLSSSEAINSQNYDFVIVPSHKRRSLHHKSDAFSPSPWISIHGFYTGPEFHRGEFATQRLLDAFGAALPADVFSQHSRQKLKPLGTPEKRTSSVLKIAFAVGGVDPLRSYTHWDTLAHHLSKLIDLEITLVGSENGLGFAKAFEESWRGLVNNAVNQTSLAQCRQLINEQDVLVACDGGLMHLGVTTHVKLISLFTSAVDPQWRLPRDRLSSALQAPTNSVNSIDPSDIAHKVIEAMRFLNR